MTERAHAVADLMARWLELAGVAIIILGVALAAAAFLWRGLRTGAWLEAYQGLRSNLGRGILLGLELLVGADIISTITAPLTVESVGLLGGDRGDPNLSQLLARDRDRGLLALGAGSSRRRHRAAPGAAIAQG